MTNVEKSWLDELVASLPGRISLAVGTTLVISALIPFFFLANPNHYFPALTIVADLFIGIVAGLSARLLMAKSPLGIKILVAFISVLGSLWLLASLTLGVAGILFSALNRLEPQASARLGLAMLSAWLALQAWRQPPSSKKSRGNQASKPSRQQQTPPAPVKIKPPTKKAPKASPKKSAGLGRKKLTVTMRRWLAKSTSVWKGYTQDAGLHLQRMGGNVRKALTPTQHWAKNSLVNLRTRLIRQKLSAPSSLLRLRQPKARNVQAVNKSIIRLTGAEEHRCPYCLEIVLENDARGVKICPVCGTYHHADCWSITGVCQVPHQHE